MFGRGRRRGKVYTIEQIAELVRPVAEEYDLEYVYVFGSYARGYADIESDVDLLVSADKVRGMEIGGLYLAFRDALGKEVDLVTNHSDPRFLRIIEKYAVKVYGRFPEA